LILNRITVCGAKSMRGMFGRIEGRLVGIAAVALLVLMHPVFAQSLDSPGEARGGPRETIIGGAPSQPFQRCIEVEIGGNQQFGCLNQQLKREVDRVTGVPNVPPIDARSSDVRVGNVNEAAVRQQYGPNYGRSVVPFRPTLTFPSPRR
jgi:hypothetical protein